MSEHTSSKKNRAMRNAVKQKPDATRQGSRYGKALNNSNFPDKEMSNQIFDKLWILSPMVLGKRSAGLARNAAISGETTLPSVQQRGKNENARA